MSWSKGEWVEDYVAIQLERNGWKIAARNFRRRGFELDIIARKNDRLICIEVKGRRHADHFDPALLLSPRKIQRLSYGMSAWLQMAACNEVANTEFWLCYVGLSRTAGEKAEPVAVYWMRLETSGEKDREEFLSEKN